jgi:hypothetical protein
MARRFRVEFAFAVNGLRGKREEREERTPFHIQVCTRKADVSQSSRSSR